MNFKLQIVILVTTSIVALPMFGDEPDVTYDSLMSNVTGTLVPITDTGVIRTLDYATRTLEISGFYYYSAPSWSTDAVTVQLLGTTAGAFELLRKDMPIEFTYYKLDGGRVITAIKEVDEAMEVEF